MLGEKKSHSDELYTQQWFIETFIAVSYLLGQENTVYVSNATQYIDHLGTFSLPINVSNPAEIQTVYGQALVFTLHWSVCFSEYPPSPDCMQCVYTVYKE